MLPLHSRSLQKIWLPSVYPARGAHPHHQSGASTSCPGEMLWQEEFSGMGRGCRLCCGGLQLQDPTSAFSKGFCIPLLGFSTCASCLLKCFMWLFPALQLISGFPWGSRAVPEFTTCGEQFDARLCAEKKPFPSGLGSAHKLAHFHTSVFVLQSSLSCIYPAKMTVFY